MNKAVKGVIGRVNQDIFRTQIWNKTNELCQHMKERINRINFIYIHFNLNGCQTDTDSSARTHSRLHPHSSICQPDFIGVRCTKCETNPFSISIHEREKNKFGIWKWHRQQKSRCNCLSDSNAECYRHRFASKERVFSYFASAWWQAMAIGIVVLVCLFLGIPSHFLTHSLQLIHAYFMPDCVSYTIPHSHYCLNTNTKWTLFGFGFFFCHSRHSTTISISNLNWSGCRCCCYCILYILSRVIGISVFQTVC